MSANLVSTSKFLSLVLRHRPELLGLELQPGGWVPVDALLAAAQAHGQTISAALLEEVVRTSDKQRFALSDDGTLIRANQGHSTQVDLGLATATPPALLYHGTVDRHLGAIRKEGLRRMQRHHVHLSADVETAMRVGARRGTPVLLTIDAGAMHAAGHRFHVSENGVWLVDAVPVEFIGFG